MTRGYLTNPLKHMTNLDISRRIKASCAIIVLATFCAGLETGLKSRVGVVSDEQAQTAIIATAQAAVTSKNIGKDDESAKISAEGVGARALSTDKTTSNIPEHE